jgi:hypothetical protein
MNLGAPVESFPPDAAVRYKEALAKEAQAKAVAPNIGPLVLQGSQGKTLRVDGDIIRISRAARTFVAAREKTLPIAQITSVEIKKPGSVVVGFIQFSIAGGAARNSSYTLTGGAFDAVQDENSVVFVGEPNYQIALAIKTYIEKWSAQHASGGNTHVVSAADEIRRFRALLDDGILTQDEFDAKKRQLLGL